MNNEIVVNTADFEQPYFKKNIFETRDEVSNILCANNPLVSVLVVTYKQLDKTKNCIESILKYTEGIDYELILVDNNSDDGTVEYLRSIEYPRKKIISITKNMLLPFGLVQGTKYCSGKYIAFLNNDMVVTTNWLTNVLKCFDSDDKIGMVCTSSTNASNYQGVNISFDSLDELQNIAQKNNISNPQKWLERLKIITLGVVYKKECIEICGNWDYGFLHNFSDDDISFRIRRAGYKLMLCRDTFVHHDHDNRVETQEKYNNFVMSIEEGRELFRHKYYGIDAWDDVCNFEFEMMDATKKPITENPVVLGIDVRCGSPLLEVKNKYKEFHIFDTKLIAYTEHAKYYTDLMTICDDNEVFCDRIEYISEYYMPNSLDCIILGKELNLYSEPINLLNDLMKIIKYNGQLLIKLRNVNGVYSLYNILGNSGLYDEDYPVNLILDDLIKWFEKKGGMVDKILMEPYEIGSEIMRSIDSFCNDNKVSVNDKNRLVTKNYVISVIKGGYNEKNR